jgi:acetyl esterase/lipase
MLPGGFTPVQSFSNNLDSKIAARDSRSNSGLFGWIGTCEGTERFDLPYIDHERMGVMGWSYGGYMMDWLEGHTQRFKAIASMMGLFDLKAFYGSTEELWFPEWDLKGQPWNSELYEKWSPDGSVTNFKTPCLVITGERDYRIPYTQSLEFFTALQKMKVPSRLLVFSNAGHWPSWYEMVLYYTAHLEWFHQYLGGGAPPWSTEQFLRNAVFDTATGKRVAAEFR